MHQRDSPKIAIDQSLGLWYDVGTIGRGRQRMARKHSPPAVFLQVQRLSDGKDPMLMDDFTGEMLPQRGTGPLPTGADIRFAQQREREGAMRELGRKLLAGEFRRKPFVRKF